MCKGRVFVHPSTKVHCSIKHYFTCGSDWVVYAMWCPCNLVYIGKTKCDMHTRLNNHHLTFRKARLDLPVPKHCGIGTQWVGLVIHDHVPRMRRGGDRLMLLKKKELHWIHCLITLKPLGLNVELKISNAMLNWTCPWCLFFFAYVRKGIMWYFWIFINFFLSSQIFTISGSQPVRRVYEHSLELFFSFLMFCVWQSGVLIIALPALQRLSCYCGPPSLLLLLVIVTGNNS